MARVQLASLGTGVAQTPNGATIPGAHGTIFLHGTNTPVTLYPTEIGGVGDTTGTFICDSQGHVPGWADLGLAVDITISSAPTITAMLQGAAGPPGANGTNGTNGSNGANGADGVPTTLVTAGNLGSTYTFTLATGTTWLVGTLNANCTITLASLASRKNFELLLTQDGTGGRTLTISDGASSQVVPIPQLANTAVQVRGEYDGTNVYVGTVGALGAPIIENVNVVTTSGSSQTLANVTVDTINYITLTANCTFTFPTAVAGKSFLLTLKQGGAGSFTATWPGTVKWPGGTAPTLTTTVAKTDVLSFICVDGTNWLGFVAGQAF